MCRFAESRKPTPLHAPRLAAANADERVGNGEIKRIRRIHAFIATWRQKHGVCRSRIFPNSIFIFRGYAFIPRIAWRNAVTGGGDFRRLWGEHRADNLYL